MRNAIFVDTVFVIALINDRDQYHQHALEAAECFGSSLLITTEAVLLEIGNALARGYKTEAIEIIEEFLESEDVEIIHLTPKLFERAFDLYRTYDDKEWGISDCISFVVMREKGLTQALTFDRHFKQAGFKVLMRDIL
jgi:uncharacterized protein